jgi:hypothetical protein
MSGAIPPLPQYTFMAWCSVKGTGATNYTFTFTLPLYVVTIQQREFTVHYSAHKSQRLDHILTSLNPSSHHVSPHILFNIILTLVSRSSQWSLAMRF